jgi:hypothetical protein
MEDGGFTAVPGSYLPLLLLISSSERCFVLDSIHPFTEQVEGFLTREVMLNSFKSLHALRTWKDRQYVNQYQYKSIS